MGRSIREVVKAIDALESVETEDDLSRLQELADQYFASRQAAKHLEVWFRLYERFPEDGDEVFWTILHGIEAQAGSDEHVVASVHRKPSQFPVLMINRMLNAEINAVDGMDLLGLLRAVAADKTCPASVREQAKGYLKHQSERG